MKSLKPVILASALALCAVMTAAAPSSAAPVNSLAANAAPAQTQAADQLPVELVAQYNRNRHGSRHRDRRPSHRHYYRGYWYATPWWLFAAPPYYAYNRCDRWRRECSRRWGWGANYRGCMRHHGCRP